MTPNGRRGAAIVMLAGIVAACALGKTAPPPPVPQVDVNRYMGVWHEVARLPMWGQRNCRSSTAEYRLLASGEVSVRNACITASGGERSIEGTATVVDTRTQAKLTVVFDQWAAKLVAWFTSSPDGNYWILRIDPDYRWAVVGTPDRDYLWILARTKELDEPVYRELVQFAHELGYDTDRLIRAPME